VEIRLLGELEVVRDGRALALPASKRTRALLGFLVVTGQPHLREKLCELFWGGPDDPRAALRWSLAKLRPLVGDWLQADRERVSLKGESDLKQVHGIDCTTATVEELRAAAQRFRGELLDGLDLPDCFRYQAWCAAEREAVRARRQAIYDVLAQQDAPEAALGWARARLAVDPLSEVAHAQVMRALHRLGRDRDALKHYDEARRLLTGELGGHIGAELERARQECLRAPVAEATVSKAAEAVIAPPRATPSGSALVGRASERAQLHQWVQAASSGRPNGVGLLVGEPGIGKSRLLDELAVTMRAAGGRVLTGRAFEAEMLRPYGAWIDALKPVDSAELPPGIDLPGSASSDRERLFDGTARLLASLAPPGRPLLLVLDDAQWLDESSAALLHYTARALEQSRVLIACGARPGELADNRAALQTVRALAKNGRLARIDLGPLSGAAIRELVGDVDVERVIAASGGNPLYALEVASSLRAGHAGGTLDHLLRERLDQVEGRARDLLPLAAAMGHSFEPALLAAAAGLPAADLLAAADELERRGILRAATGGGWDFSHDLVRDAAYRSLSEPRRRLVHLQIASALARLSDPDGARAGERAHHAALGGDHEAAARAWLLAGERCVRVFAHAEGKKAAERGLALAEKLPRELRAELEMPLYDVLLGARHGIAGPDEEARISRAIVFAEAAGRADHVQRGFYLLSYVGFRAQDFDLAFQSTVRSAEAVRDTDPATAARTLASTARCLVLIERDMPRALQLAHEVEQLARTHQLKLHEVPWALGMVHHYTGDLERASDEHQQAIRLNQATQDHFADSVCLSELAAIELERRRFVEARAWAARAIEVVDKMGDGSEGPFAAAIDALARFGAGEAGEEEVERALATLRNLDAQALLSYACNTLAELQLERGNSGPAAAAARRALEAARVVDRKSEMALAMALLCKIANASGDRKEAARLIQALQPLVDGGAALSARARRHLSAVLTSAA
jgi:predicted ATPase/DNA-binding SARP family transcriptional activator